MPDRSLQELTEVALPALARAERWPIRHDHCFKRICLDFAFGGVWYDYLPKPAERHLAGEALERAIACAEELAGGDPALLGSRALLGNRALLDERNRQSLRWRGKMRGRNDG